MAVSKEQTVSWNQTTDDTVTTVISAVASFKDVDPMDLTPIYDVVDPDALEALVDGDSSSYCHIAFEYAGVLVELDSSGGCTVTEIAGN